MVRIVAISDIHLTKPELPIGDILIVAGDALNRGSIEELIEFKTYLLQEKHKFKHIVYVPGNHDRVLESNTQFCRQVLKDFIVLINEEVILENLRIYGSPYTPISYNWAFMLDSVGLKENADKIPENLDVLITHGPPANILDGHPMTGKPLGDYFLREAVFQKKPCIHLFGHIHEHGGSHLNFNDIHFYNVAVCDEMYMPTNKITTIDLEPKYVYNA